MTKFAVAISAVNLSVEQGKVIPLTTRMSGVLNKWLACRASIYVADSAKDAQEEALEHCKKLFPAQNGWSLHTVDVCTVEQVLLNTAP